MACTQEQGAAGALQAYALGFVEPFGTLWFIYLLPVFFVVTKLLRPVPPLAVFLAAAVLEMAPIHTGWMVIDEFATRFVYFFAGYWLAPHVFRFAEAVSCAAAQAIVALAFASGPRSTPPSCCRAGPRCPASRWRWASSVPPRWCQWACCCRRPGSPHPFAMSARIPSSSISPSSSSWRQRAPAAQTMPGARLDLQLALLTRCRRDRARSVVLGHAQDAAVPSFSAARTGQGWHRGLAQWHSDGACRIQASLKPGDHLYLIDGSGYIFRAYHALPPLTRKSDGLPVGAVQGFCNMLWKLLKETQCGQKPTHLAVIFDKSSKTFRNDIYPEYKAHRPEPPADLRPQFGLIRQATRAFNVAGVEQDNYEADDLIATYARQAVEAGATCRIVSSDKDLMQLVRHGVTLFDTMKDKELGEAEVLEKFGVTPDKVIDVQALAGDRSTMCRAFPASASRPGPSSSPNMAISKRCWRGPPRSSSRSAART